MNKKTSAAIPHSILEKEGTVVLFDPGAGEEDPGRVLLFHEPVNVLRTSRIDEVESLLREADRQAGTGMYVAGYVAYEAGFAFVDRLAAASPASFPFDLAWFGLYRTPIIAAADEIIPPPVPGEAGIACDPSGVIDQGLYHERIGMIRDLLQKGEIYQVNYTWRAKLPPVASPSRVFSSLLGSRPAPYSALLNTGGTTAISLSPELFFRRTGGRITARPMKGTMPRGSGPAEDEAMRARLASSEKDRAENLMIVDLLRNDLNRICVPGSVSVPELFTVEEYPTLFQMTSTVTGMLEKGIECADIFASLFPCGSVTGAPKVRSMEIIRELEDGPRGIYTGSIGFIAPGGDALFNVAIRTLVRDPDGTSVGVGGGIVWDSDAAGEYRECHAKLGFLRGRDRSFSLIESMLCENGSIPLLRLHIERMSRSAAALDIPFDRDEMEGAVDSCRARLDAEKKYKIRVLCGPRGRFTVEAAAIESAAGSGTIMLAQERTRPGDPFLYHKTTMRGMYEDNHRRARKLGHDDAVFMNTRGEITEGCISSIFVRKNGRLYTPPVSCGLLPGVMRNYILTNEPAAWEKILYPRDLYEADEIFICNAVRGMRKVRIAVPR